MLEIIHNDKPYQISSDEDEFEDYISQCDNPHLLETVFSNIQRPDQLDLYCSFFNSKNPLTISIFQHSSPSLNQYIGLQFTDIGTYGIYKKKIIHALNSKSFGPQDFVDNMKSNLYLDLIKEFIEESEYQTIEKFKMSLFINFITSLNKDDITKLYDFFTIKHNIFHFLLRNVSVNKRVEMIEYLYHVFGDKLISYMDNPELHTKVATFHNFLYETLTHNITFNQHGKEIKTYLKSKDFIEKFLILLLNKNIDFLASIKKEKKDMPPYKDDTIYNILKKVKPASKEIFDKIIFALKHPSIEEYFYFSHGINHKNVLKECYDTIILSSIWFPMLSYIDIKTIENRLIDLNLEDSHIMKLLKSHPEYKKMASTLLDIINKA